MKLSVLERVVCLSLLPQQGSFATLKVLHDLRMILSFSEKEMKEWGIKENPETKITTWERDETKELPIGEKATDIIIEALREHDRKNSLPVQAMSLYEKFIPTT